MIQVKINTQSLAEKISPFSLTNIMTQVYDDEFIDDKLDEALEIVDEINAAVIPTYMFCEGGR